MNACVYTLGCKVNQYESESLCKQLVENGFSVSTKLCNADFYIINSCAVTNEAEHKSREIIAKILKLNPNAKIYICGCSSELHPENFLNKPNVVAICGTENKSLLIDAIKNNKTGNLIEKINNKTYCNNYLTTPLKTRTSIKIQDGCNNFCSYCIIPYLRGRERSRSVEDIKKELDNICSQTKEIVLVGINMAGYGKDLNPKQNLTDVVKLFQNYPNFRLRFSSLEMGTITEELLQELSKNKNFCPFFHLSLQSASNNVLQKMNRHYTFEEYLKTINLIREYFPLANISTDIIVGFPTETEDDFNNCLTNVEKVNFANTHIFPYSKREGTVAAKYKEINGKIIKERIKKIKEVCDKSKEDFINKMQGEIEEVLIEKKEEAYYVGYTKNYIYCYINSKTDITNKIVKVKLTTKHKNGLIGEIYE